MKWMINIIHDLLVGEGPNVSGENVSDDSPFGLSGDGGSQYGDQ